MGLRGSWTATTSDSSSQADAQRWSRFGAVSMVCGLGSTAIVLFESATNINGRFHNAVSRDQILLVALIWAVVAVVNVAYALALSVRSRSDNRGP